MKNDPTRRLLEIILRRTLEEIRRDPERSVRNLVDLALLGAKGRFQTQALELLQAMLQNPNSYYYSLIRDTVLHTDPERLLGFGLNLGYNGCTRGAARIRQIERERGFNVPWTLSLQLTADGSAEGYERLICQGEEMGIRFWQLYATGAAGRGLELAEEHPDNAFALLLEPAEIDLTLLDRAGEMHNLMLLVKWGPDCPDACDLLRQAELLYGIWNYYGEKDLGQIMTGEVFRDAVACHGAVTALVPGEDCDEELRAAACSYITDARSRQLFCTMPWEAAGDSGYVDGIISEENCTAGFDGTGVLRTPRGRHPGCNYREHSLEEILRTAFPVKGR